MYCACEVSSDARLGPSALAETIDAPPLYTHERLPQGPRWSEVQQLLDANRGDAAAQIRNYAMLVLQAVYGFRSGEMCGLTLDDIDWSTSAFIILCDPIAVNLDLN